MGDYMRCGIYQIKNKTNNKIYVGSSKYIEKRWKRHLSNLKAKKHCNPYLQNSFNKHGEEIFEFTILEECDESQLLIQEQYWIDKLTPEYNIGSVGGGSNYTKNPLYKKPSEYMTKEERREKWGLIGDKNPSWKGGITKRFCLDCGKKITFQANKCIKCHHKFGDKNPFYGKHHSDETKRKISLANSGKRPCRLKPISIHGVIYDSIPIAAKILNISISTISRRIKSDSKNYFLIKKL